MTEELHSKLVSPNVSVSDVPVVIFCGGRGTRLKEETGLIPKPLVKVGEFPILWHIMKIYHAQGYRKFVLLVGYLGDKIKEYFYSYPIHRGNFTIRFGKEAPEVEYHSVSPEQWEVTVLDTGVEAETGARLFRAKDFLRKGRFLLTYGDGVADINLGELIRFHEAHDEMATVTGVRPPSRFGSLDVEGPLAVMFREKPELHSSYINGGFFVMEPAVLDLLTDDPRLNFERDILPELTKRSTLGVYPHNGYWQCMDTLRDVEFLNEEWRKGNPPWKIWRD